jgi:tape measure domain-containing protein
MADDIRIKISDNISAAIEKKVRGIGTAARETHSDVERLKAALKGFTVKDLFGQANSQANRYKKTIQGVTQATNQLRTASNTARTSIQRLGTTATGAAGRVNTLANSLNKVRTTSQATGTSLGTLLNYFIGLQGAQLFIDIADAATTMDNKVKTVTNTVAEFRDVQSSLFDLARRSRSSVEGIADSYVRYRKVLGQLGASQRETIQFTETIVKGFRAAGKTTAEAAQSSIQLAQGLQKGRLDGDELKSVLEGMPIEIVHALAKAVGTTAEGLRDAGAAGNISVAAIREAVRIAAPDIERLFRRTTATIHDGFEAIRTEAIRFFTENTAASQTFVNALMWVADNVRILIPIVGALAAAWALVQLATIIKNFYLLAAAIVAVTLPTIGWAAALTGAVGLLLLFGASIAQLTGKTKEFNDWLDGTVNSLGDVAVAVIKTVQEGLGLDTLNNSTKDLERTFAATAATVNTTGAAVKGIAGGVTSVDAIKRAMDGTKASADGAATSSTKAAGAIQSISGQYNGVINVQQALKGTAGAADELGAAGNKAYESVKSISGQANGVYRLKTELNDTNNVLQRLANSAATFTQRMAQATVQAAKLAATVIPGVGSASKAGGYGTNITGNMSGGSIQNLGNNAKGGSYMIGGKSGIDQNMVKFNASKGERVDVLTKRQQRMEERLWNMMLARGTNSGAATVNFYITTPDAESFRRSRRQISHDMMLVQGAA